MSSLVRSSQTGSLIAATSQAAVKEQMSIIVDALKMIGAGNANFKPLSPDVETDLLNTKYCIYVNPEIGSDNVVYGNYNADRQQLNQELECGYSPFRPFKTFARAAAEVARRSILAGASNDIYNRAAIFYDISDGYIYNGLGSASVSAWSEGSVSSAQLQALNDSNTPGSILPRGVSVIGRVLRNSVLRPTYVPAGSSNAVTSRAAIFRATGGSFFFNFTFQDDLNTLSSHHLVHSHEFCDQADLVAYYAKIMTAFGLTGAEVINPGETEIVAPAPDGVAASSVDTTKGSSPYIFNCSIRSDFGMSGPVIDGRSVTGFRSMEAANFSMISLQTDYANAFQKYESGSWVNVTSFADYANTNINDLRLKTSGTFDWATGTYQTDYRHHGFKLIGKAFVQEVSEFTIGSGVHHWVASGSDADLSGCNAAFGGTATLAHGFNGIGEAGGAFPQDQGFLGIALKRPLKIAEDGTNLRRVTIGQVAQLTGYVTDGTGTYIKLASALTDESFSQLGITLTQNHYIWISNSNRNVGPGAITGQPELSTAIDVRAQLAATPWTTTYPDRIYVQTGANNNILSNGMTVEELAFNNVYVRRLVDTRSASEREYSVIVSNTNIAATRQPPAGFVVRLASRANVAQQIDPSNGASQVFVVDSSSVATVASPVADTAYYSTVLRPGDSIESHSASKFYFAGTPISRNNRILRATRNISPSAFSANDWVEANRDLGDSRGVFHPRSNIAPRITLDKDLSNDPASLTLGINQSTDTDFLAQLQASTDYIAVEKFLTAVGYATPATILAPQATEATRLFDPAAVSSPTPAGKLTTRSAWPLEFNKPSIIEAGGTIFRYIGRFNYSKALPKYQITSLTDQNKIDAAVTPVCGGAIYADGSIENGLRLQGDTLIDLASGRDTSVETAGIGGLSDPGSLGPAREDREFTFGDDLNVDGNLTVDGSAYFTSFASEALTYLKATTARYGIARQATNNEVDGGLNGTPVTDGPAFIAPDQLQLVLTKLKVMADSESILYVDGGVTISSGLANYASISNAIWTDIKTNRVIHNVADWTGTVPASTTDAAAIARKVCFGNLKQAFDFIANRNPVSRSEIIIYLYNSSDANTGAGNFAVLQYDGTSLLSIKRGPSAARSAGVLWGQEHFSGIIRALNTRLNLSEVNLNISGTAANTTRQIAWDSGMFCLGYTVVTCRAVFRSSLTGGYAILFNSNYLDATSIFELNRSQTALTSGITEKCEFAVHLSQPAGNTVQYSSWIIQTFQVRINSNSYANATAVFGQTTPQMPIDVTMSIGRTTASTSPMGFALASQFFFISNSVNSALSTGFTMSLNLTGTTNATNFNWFRNVDTNASSSFVEFRLTGTSPSPVSFTMLAGQMGSVTTAYGYFSGGPAYVVANTVGTPASQTNYNSNGILAKLANGFTGIAGVTNYDWYIGAGSYRDGYFLSTFEQV